MSSPRIGVVLKNSVKVVTALAAALALIVLPSASASAFTDTAITGSEAYYIGSTLYAHDTKADGKSSIAEIRSTSMGANYSLTNSGGNGTTLSATVLMSTNYQLRACVQDIGGGGTKTCGPWVNGTH